MVKTLVEGKFMRDRGKWPFYVDRSRSMHTLFYFEAQLDGASITLCRVQLYYEG